MCWLCLTRQRPSVPSSSSSASSSTLSLSSSSSSALEGIVFKEGKNKLIRRFLKKRLLVYDDAAKHLQYFTPQGTLKGTIYLHDILFITQGRSTGKESKKDCVFEITIPGRVYVFQVSIPRDTKKWIGILTRELDDLKRRDRIQLNNNNLREATYYKSRANSVVFNSLKIGNHREHEECCFLFDEEYQQKIIALESLCSLQALKIYELTHVVEKTQKRCEELEVPLSEQISSLREENKRLKTDYFREQLSTLELRATIEEAEEKKIKEDLLTVKKVEKKHHPIAVEVQIQRKAPATKKPTNSDNSKMEEIKRLTEELTKTKALLDVERSKAFNTNLINFSPRTLTDPFESILKNTNTILNNSSSTTTTSFASSSSSNPPVRTRSNTLGTTTPSHISSTPNLLKYSQPTFVESSTPRQPLTPADAFNLRPSLPILGFPPIPITPKPASVTFDPFDQLSKPSQPSNQTTDTIAVNGIRPISPATVDASTPSNNANSTSTAPNAHSTPTVISTSSIDTALLADFNITHSLGSVAERSNSPINHSAPNSPAPNYNYNKRPSITSLSTQYPTTSNLLESIPAKVNSYDTPVDNIDKNANGYTNNSNNNRVKLNNSSGSITNSPSLQSLKRSGNINNSSTNLNLSMTTLPSRPGSPFLQKSSNSSTGGTNQPDPITTSTVFTKSVTDMLVNERIPDDNGIAVQFTEKLKEAVAEISRLVLDLQLERKKAQKMEDEKSFMLESMEEMKAEHKRMFKTVQSNRDDMETLLESTEIKLNEMRATLRLENQRRLAAEAELQKLGQATQPTQVAAVSQVSPVS